MFWLGPVIVLGGIAYWLLRGSNAADAEAEAKKNEEAKDKLLKLISKIKKYLREAEDEHKVCSEVCCTLKEKTDSGIRNAKHLRNEKRAKKKLSFKTKEVNAAIKALDGLLDELNELYGCHYNQDDIMELEISDNDDETEGDEKKELLKQLPLTKKQWKETVSERKVCRDTWFQLKNDRREDAALRRDPEENEKFKMAIEKLRSAGEKERLARTAFESQVNKLSVLCDCQDDTINLSEMSDSESDIESES